MSKEITSPPPDEKGNLKVEVICGNIARLEIETIASVITTDLSIIGRLNRAIFAGAGQALDNFILDHIIEPQEGDVFWAPGFNLPADKIIFAVMPHWRSDLDVVDKHLLKAVSKIMKQANDLAVKELAIPILCSGRGGYPKPRAVRLIVQAINDSVAPNLQRLCFVCENMDGVELFRQRLSR